MRKTRLFLMLGLKTVTIQTVPFAFAIATLFCLSAFADDLPDQQKTPGAILDTVPDEQAANCLSDKTGTSVQTGDAITTALICTLGYSKCIRKFHRRRNNRCTRATVSPEITRVIVIRTRAARLTT